MVSDEQVRIPPPVEEPEDTPDSNTADLLASMNPSKRSVHLHQRLLQKAEARCEELKEERRRDSAELDRLRGIEREFIRLDERHRQSRLVISGTVVAMGIGGGLVSYHAGEGGNSTLLALGWFLIAIPGGFQFLKSALGLKF